PLEADRRRHVMPFETEIRELGARPAHRLADREIKRMRHKGHLSRVHPCLQQAGVDIDESRAPKTLHNASWGSVGEVDQQIRIADCVDANTLAGKVCRNLVTIGPDRDPFGQSIWLKPASKTGE